MKYCVTMPMAAYAFAEFAVAGATMPEFLFQPRDMLPTNVITMFTQPQTGYAVQFWMTPQAHARLQSFAKSNFGKDVVIRYGASVTVTSRYMVKQASSVFVVSRSTRDDAIRLASSLGLARDLRLRCGQRPFGLLENPPGTTAFFAGSIRPFWTVSLSVAQCLLVCGGAGLSLFIFMMLLQKRKATHENTG
jgi:hypothetical protein